MCWRLLAEEHPDANQYCERWEGPIRSLLSHLAAWDSLQREGIITIDHLEAEADRREQLAGIGPKMARVIRDELARVSAPERPMSDKA